MGEPHQRDPSVGEEEEEVEARIQILNHVFAFVETVLVRGAVRLGIPDIIHKHNGLITLEDLASKLPMESVNIGQLHQIMRYMAHIMNLFKVVTKSKGKDDGDGEDYYGLTPVSEILVSSHERSLATLVLVEEPDTRDLIARWAHMVEGLDLSRYPKSFWDTHYGVPFYEVIAKDKRWNEMMIDGMTSLTTSVIGSLVEGLKRAKVFDDVSTLVDVGGNTGDVAVVLADAFPHMKCTVLELPHVVESAPKHTKVEFVAGDMFEHIPSADAVLVKVLLHNCDDDASIKILSKSKEAILSNPGKGKVIVVETVLDLEDRPEFKDGRYGLDLEMISMSGKERTKKEWVKLFHKAGFSHHEIFPIAALDTIIVLYP